MTAKTNSRTVWVSVATGLLAVTLPTLFKFGISACYYALNYDTSPANVTIQHKPENCDYDWSPVGKKGCHYEKSVNTFVDDKHKTQVIVSWTRQEDE
jgi:hypothetical protein